MRGPIRSVLFAAFAVVGCMLTLGASSAMAQLVAAGGEVTGSLRDDLTTAPSNAQYGADLLATNTKGPLQLTDEGALQTPVNKSPQYYAFVGVKLHSNPTAANCSVTTGYAEFADFQHATHGTTPSPVYSDTLIDPWRIDIRSHLCATNPDRVTVYASGLYFPVLGIEVRGNIVGTYQAPIAGCSAGGINLDLEQPGLLANGAAVGAGINNGTLNEHAFLCFISSNDYVYPTNAGSLTAITGTIKNE